MFRAPEIAFNSIKYSEILNSKYSKDSKKCDGEEKNVAFVYFQLYFKKSILLIIEP